MHCCSTYLKLAVCFWKKISYGHLHQIPGKMLWGRINICWGKPKLDSHFYFWEFTKADFRWKKQDSFENLFYCIKEVAVMIWRKSGMNNFWRNAKLVSRWKEAISNTPLRPSSHVWYHKKSQSIAYIYIQFIHMVYM